MKSNLILLTLVVVIALSGCNQDKKAAVPQTFSNVSVRTSYDPVAKFPTGGKFAFVQLATDKEPSSEAALVEQRVRTALTGELKKKGYKPGEYDDIGFYVVYALGLQQQIDVLVAKSKIQGNEWITAIVAPNDYVSGALLVEMIDAKSMKPVWLGAFNADVALTTVDEQQKKERVGYAVRELLKPFPPK
jgi:hypothetical protein